MYVDFNFDKPLHSRRSLGRIFPDDAKKLNVSASVDQAPDGVFFPPLIFNLSNNISPICLGDPKLNSLPTISKHSFSIFLISFSNFIDKSLNIFSSTQTPFFSISIMTLAKGLSIVS